MKDRDIIHWSDKRKLAWIRRELMRSEHYEPSFTRLSVEWFNTDFFVRATSGDLVKGSLLSDTLEIDTDLTAGDLHSLWIIQSGINHYRRMIMIKGLLPMEHGK